MRLLCRTIVIRDNAIMGCSAVKGTSLDRIPSTSSVTDIKAMENGHVLHAKGTTNHVHHSDSRVIEQKDHSNGINSTMNGDKSNSDRNPHEVEVGLSKLDSAIMKKRKDVPLSGPIYDSSKEVSKSQSDFFKMLDARIEQGQDYDPDEVT